MTITTLDLEQQKINYLKTYKYMMDNQSSASDKNNRYIDGIPIRNLWVLILYASDSYKELGIDHVELKIILKTFQT